MSAYQRYEFDAWPVGHYSTSNFAGSRSGGPVASAWAVMRHLGQAGFRALVAKMLAAKAELAAGIGRIDGLEICGKPDGTQLSFGSPSLNIDAVAGEMNRLGWSFARQTDPAGILLLLNGFHGEIVADFLADLEATAGAVKSGRIRATAGPAVYPV